MILLYLREQLKMWEGDLLGRERDGDYILRFLLRRIDEKGSVGEKKSVVLNIDSRWGRGKSWFLGRLKDEIEGRGYLVAAVNAWENDFADDPLIPVLFAIDEAVRAKPIGGEVALATWKTATKAGGAIVRELSKGAAVQLAKKFFGEGVEAAMAVVSDNQSGSSAPDMRWLEDAGVAAVEEQADEILKKFRSSRENIDKFKLNIEKYLETTLGARPGAPLFVLVDELDRCRPSFSIQLLERIKHLFNINNVIFIIATDTEQLSYSISALYGQSFHAKHYLRRFFDKTYTFEEPDIVEFVKGRKLNVGAVRVELPGIKLSEALPGVFGLFDLSLRDIEQCMDLFQDLLTGWEVNIPLHFYALMPMLVASQQGIVPSWGGEFSEQVDSLLRNGTGFQKIKFRSYNPQHAHQEHEVYHIFQIYQKYYSRPINSVPQVNSGDLSEVWVVEQFAMEFSTVYNNNIEDVRSPPLFSISSYPSIISRMGRWDTNGRHKIKNKA